MLPARYPNEPVHETPFTPRQCRRVLAVSCMMLATIVGLVVLCGWLAVKLGAANKDNADLRTRIDSLKRQLVRLR
jgi:sensor domain CHASE-containing protein